MHVTRLKSRVYAAGGGELAMKWLHRIRETSCSGDPIVRVPTGEEAPACDDHSSYKSRVSNCQPYGWISQNLVTSPDPVACLRYPKQVSEAGTIIT
jgi:hypothetical protein